MEDSCKAKKTEPSSSLCLKGRNRNNACKEESRNKRSEERDEKNDQKMVIITHLIKPIEERLSVLEEEDELLKETVVKSMEEMRILMNQIFKRFQNIQLSNQDTEKNRYSDEVLLFSNGALKVN